MKYPRGKSPYARGKNPGSRNKFEFKKGHASFVSTPEVREKFRLALLKRENYFKTHTFVGENHSKWKGDKAKYITMHIWVARWKGKPKLCEHCGTTTAKRFEWANKDHKYKRDLNDYIRLCRKCHEEYDKRKS